MSSSEQKRPKVDPYYQGEPHPLPETRKWMADYRRWVAEGCPSREEEAARRAAGVEPGAPFQEWLGKNQPPDLQELVDFAGRRYAASIGETYTEDPVRRMREAPHQGGYSHITAEEWAAYDKAMVEWQARRLVR
jgi:hypothetical protein